MREFLGAKSLPKKAILVVDNAACHPQNGELQSDDGLITTFSLPPNCTALIQPLDQNIMQIIKLNYKKSLLADLISTEGTDLNAKLKSYNLKKAVCNLAHAWEKVPSTSIQKSWNNLMSGNDCWTEEDELPLSVIRAEITRENSYISSLLNEVASNHNIYFNECSNWITESSSDPYQFNEEVTDITEDVTEILAEEDFQEPNVQVPKIKTDEAIKCINCVIQWASENDFPTNQILVLKDLRDAALAEKIKKPMMQPSISNFFKKA